MRATIHRRLTLLPLALVIAALGACGDDPTDVGEHLEVDGFALFRGTTQIYRYTLDDGAASTLTLGVGTHAVVFIPLDANGEAIPEEAGGNEEEVVVLVIIDDPSILDFTPASPGGVHDFVESRGELEALQPGSTTMTVCVPHGSHCDLEVDVPVAVLAP